LKIGTIPKYEGGVIMDSEPQKLQFKHSRQRDAILDILRGTSSHPAANWIYQQAKSEFPALSLGTVYRNLTILKQQGLVNEVNSGNRFRRFDANVKPHCHVVCCECGKIIDIEMPGGLEVMKFAAKRLGFTIHSHEIEFRGVCRDCG
jgi:Fur family peroxide stress response transcriptional regulator